MLVHRGEDRVDLGPGLRRDVVRMVRSPHVRMRWIGDDMAVRRRDVGVAKPALPAISLGDGVGCVSRHDMWSRIEGKSLRRSGWIVRRKAEVRG
jgi:hypothetical protein